MPQPCIVEYIRSEFWQPIFHRLFGNLPFLNTHLLILGSDLNCVIDPASDRSNPQTLTQSSTSKSISVFMLKNGFVDP